MKAICVVICAFMASGLAASADSIEQVMSVFVSGAYQGVSTNSSNNRNVEIDRVQIFRINTANLVHALAIDYATNGPNYNGVNNGLDYYNGALVYKTSLDGSITNVVLKRTGFPELNVTGAFTFTPGSNVVAQTLNTTNDFVGSHVETGLMQLKFSTSSAQFTANGFAYGTSTRTHSPIVGTNSYATLLSYSGGSGIASINTNVYTFKTNSFAGTNLVSGPAQILFKTYGPVRSTTDVFVE